MKTILWLEDEKLFAELVHSLRQKVDQLFLGNAELQVLRTLEMGRAALRNRQVAMVILDLSLPDSGQVDTIEMITKEHRDWPPIFVLTGDERIEVRRECLLGGAQGFALKKHVMESSNFFFASLYNMYLMHLRDHGNGRSI